MMEIIAVIVILGIITAVAIPRFTKSRTDDLAAANTLKAHLRYAQLRALRTPRTRLAGKSNEVQGGQ